MRNASIVCTMANWILSPSRPTTVVPSRASRGLVHRDQIARLDPDLAHGIAALASICMK